LWQMFFDRRTCIIRLLGCGFSQANLVGIPRGWTPILPLHVRAMRLRAAAMWRTGEHRI